ncbi:MAG TPA: haloacid dehalogenase-like hydrolase [Actinomycetota bacterium]|nr:haloacid dehalogenase-like hydrolase [Actinomycetota bacterium]
MRKSTPRAARNPVDRRDQGDRHGGARSRFLVLWDIDGTLVQAGDVGRDIFTEAFQAVLGRAPNQVAARMLAMAGRTDPEIALEFLAAHEIAEAEGERHLPAFSEALATALAAKAALIRERGRALPGAREILAALGRSDGVVQSLLTGNVQPNALLKLASFELDGYLDFDVGGFGSDNRHRPSLVEVARAKAEGKYGTAFAGPATVLVGDTPLDVDAGQAGGARVVAVATGPYGVAELEATGADAVLADLRDTEAALAAILA